jgi:hypothetical protein
MRTIQRWRVSPWLLLLSLLTSGAACSKSVARPTRATPKKASTSQLQSDAAQLELDAAQPQSDASPLEPDAAVVESLSPIWRENMRRGVAHESPDHPAGNEVAGYSSVVSAAPGTTIQLFVNVDHDQNVRWNLYRVGYYGGLGTRLIAEGEPRSVSVQPECPTDADTGLIECSWAPAFDVAIDPDWVSGYYFFELVNDDGFGARVPLIVREGDRHAEALVEASVNTWQAYNRWGGISLYANDHRDGPYKQGSGHRVSFDRPYAGQNELAPFLDMIRFLEQRGYDLSYTTNVDVDADPDALNGRKLFMTVAHGEYWTVAERNTIEVARAQGVSLGFFSANTGYWRVRLDASSSGNPRRIVTCYKSALTDPVQNARDTTGMFRNPPYARPENALIGVGYRTWSKVPGYPYIVTNPEHWVYEGTGVKMYDALSNVVGSEWDGVTDNGNTPEGLEVVARAITIDNDGAFIEGEANATVYYPTPTSFVFAGGSISWGSGLGQGRFADARVERMTENVLARAGLVGALPLTEPAQAPAPVAAFEAKVLAGNGAVSQSDGPALEASFVAPTGITAGLDGKLYIVDRGDHVIRVLGRDGKLSSMVSFDSAVFARPMGLAVDSKGTLYLSDSRKNRIFKLSSDGTVTPYAGAGPSGSADASDPLSATFFGPRGIAIGPDDALYVADNMNNAIRRIDPAGVTTVATDLRFVTAVAAGPDGAVYFSTIANAQIGVVRHGQVTILANVAGQPGNQEGPAALARLQPGEGLLVDGERLLFADTENNRVRALTLTDPQMISTVFGDGNATADMSDAKHTWLPRGIVRFDGGYAVSDFGSHRVLWFKEAKPNP